MKNRNQTDFKSGFLVVNKPVGPTSHDVIKELRKITGVKKIGHAGTLDPAASGVLLVGIGRMATRQLGLLNIQDKEYIASIKLGVISDTYDREGVITAVGGKKIAINRIKKALIGFKGDLEQIPPMYSAKKIQGQKLYHLARAGIVVPRKPAKVTIYDFTVMAYDWPMLKIRIRCSSGTYIRSLAHDIGQTLGCGGYLADLKRISVGNFHIGQAVKFKGLNKSIISKKLLENLNFF